MPPRKKVEEVEEPLEAQPPAGIVLEEPSFVGEASDEEMRRLMEAAHRVVEDELDIEEDIPVASAVAPKTGAVERGSFVTYVLGRDIIEDLRAKGVGVNALAMGDVAPAIVIAGHEDGSADLRVFVDAEDLPLRRGVKQIVDPKGVTLDHVNFFYLEK